jgi:hypothetical protein
LARGLDRGPSCALAGAIERHRDEEDLVGFVHDPVGVADLEEWPEHGEGQVRRDVPEVELANDVVRLSTASGSESEPVTGPVGKLSNYGGRQRLSDRSGLQPGTGTSR